MTGKPDNINPVVDGIISIQGTSVESVIPILQAIQEHFRYLPEDALKRVCETTGISPARIEGIASFYSQFRRQEVGKHIIRICTGTACHVKGALNVYDAFRRELRLQGEEDTDADKLFTLEKVACLGCCTLAPVVRIDDITYGHVTAEKTGEILKEFLSKKKTHRMSPAKKSLSLEKVQGEIRIGLGSCCIASGSSDIRTELEHTLIESGINVHVKQVGCVGICNQVPVLEVVRPGEKPAVYAKIKPEDVREVVLSHFRPQGWVSRIRNRITGVFDNMLEDGFPSGYQKYNWEQRDSPVSMFMSPQLSIATENRGNIKPCDIDEYQKEGGFSALSSCLHGKTRDEVVDEITRSGLRGRGGAGFPTGRKWRLVREQDHDEKYIICNGDEGDPGAFMDRMLLESYPFRVIEGMLIAGYAAGASRGIFYIRAEYPLALSRIREALELCRQNDILGQRIMESDFNFEISVFEGAGAFVCGEETALIASMEGNRGMPRIRPPYPAHYGFKGKPTLVNNVETLSLVSWIIRQGAERFAGIGTAGSKGTKVFALAGKVNRGGLIEVPMGISIRQIVEEIGGGIANGKTFKAVQIGGPSGGCLPASLADLPIDYQALQDAGAMMGSGGLIVMDENDCMVDIARYFLSFTQSQSCGKCTFCRIGTRRMLELLDRIRSGEGNEEDLVQLEKLALSTKKGSLCGLGKSAPNPVLSTMRYFREEYEAHLRGKCPAGKCSSIIKYVITEECIGCTICAQRCPSEAIAYQPYEVHHIDAEKCIKCDICRQTCPTNAITVE